VLLIMAAIWRSVFSRVCEGVRLPPFPLNLNLNPRDPRKYRSGGHHSCSMYYSDAFWILPQTSVH
jgi:hypothetical protein